jgi:hypothetical protein
MKWGPRNYISLWEYLGVLHRFEVRSVGSTEEIFGRARTLPGYSQMPGFSRKNIYGNVWRGVKLSQGQRRRTLNVQVYFTECRIWSNFDMSRTPIAPALNHNPPTFPGGSLSVWFRHRACRSAITLAWITASYFIQRRRVRD